jgi:DNA-binding GntR family transcriptional regulator
MSGKGKKPIGRPRGTGSQRVHERIRDKILRLELAPGADLDEAGLEHEFAVSRTPVREALIRLASEGLVTLMPNRGARVTPLELTDVPQLLEALELHHRVIMRWAARRRGDADLVAIRQTHQAFAEAARAGDPDSMIDANKAFHMAIAGSCGNRYLAQASESLQTVSLRLARLSFAGDGGMPEYGNAEVVRDHAEMIAAIEAGDAEAADALAIKHMRIFRARVAALIDASLAGDVALE